MAVSRKLDSLNLAYAQTQNLSALHNQKEDILLGEKDQDLETGRNRRNYLWLGLVGVGLLTLVLLIWGILYRRKKIKLEAEFVRMKAELEAYLAQQPKVPPAEFSDPAGRPEPGEPVEVKATLSERQREVLKLLSAGLSNHEIAARIFVSENTVKYHSHNIYQILNIMDRKDLLIRFRK